MFITRECDYAVRVISALAGGSRLSVSEICEKESITAPFAYKILKKLQEAGLVKGFRGVHGGYALNCGPEEITLYDIYSAVDPELLIIECMGQGYECVRNGKSDGQCMVHCELEEIQKELWALLKRKNMKELLGKE